MPIIKPYKGIDPTIGESVFLAENAVVIGDVVIGDQSSIWYNCTVRGDVNHIRIGDRTNIQDGTVIHVDHKKHPAIIGNDVTVGHMALLHACTVEDESLIGMMSCVMDGAVVEKHAIVAAGAVVTPGKRVPSGELWAGTPAKFVRKVTPEEIEWFLYSSNHYVNLSKNYL